MALKIPAQPNYFKVGTSSDRNVQWHDGSMVYVEDITTFFILDSGVWKTISTSTVGVTGSFVDNNANTVTVKDGLITDFGV